MGKKGSKRSLDKPHFLLLGVVPGGGGAFAKGIFRCGKFPISRFCEITSKRGCEIQRRHKRCMPHFLGGYSRSIPQRMVFDV